MLTPRKENTFNMNWFYSRLEKRGDKQDGINMVDLMMWLVIAALLLASAIQGVAYYQQSAYLYQMKEALDIAASRTMALAANDGTVDPDDADTVIAEENAATPDDNITLSVDTIALTASGPSTHEDSIFERASLATATTVGSGDTFYIRASHSLASKSDVVYFFEDTASKKTGMHVVNKGVSEGPGGGSSDPAPEPTTEPTTDPTTEPTEEPTPEPTEEPVEVAPTLSWSTYSSGSVDVHDIASSSDGLQAWLTRSGDHFPLHSSDSGASWRKSNVSTATWRRSATMSADGQTIVNAKDGGIPYYSRDGGSTWVSAKINGTDIPVGQHWLSAVSADGKYMYASSFNSSYYNENYYSSDYGATWNKAASLSSFWVSEVATSDTGAVVFYGAEGNTVPRISKDYGKTSTVISGLPAGKWFSADLSPDGTTIAATDYSTSGGLWISKDSGATWTKSTTFPDVVALRSVSISDDGKQIAVGVANDYIYISTDSGATWNAQTDLGKSNWRAIATSSDHNTLIIGGSAGKIVVGKYSSAPAEETAPETAGITWTSSSHGTTDWLDVAVSADGSTLLNTRNINTELSYISRDSGTTWNSVPTSTGLRRSASMSADGQTIIASKDGASVHFTKDGGATWKQATINGSGIPNHQYWYTTMSADGSKMYAAGIYDSTFTRTYFSSDGGTTWKENSNYSQFAVSEIAASDDGSVLFAGRNNGLPVISKNNGATWTNVTVLPSGEWFSADISADGKYIIATDHSATGGVWVSTDYGVSWGKKANLPVQAGWRSASISSDGQKMAAAVNGGYIYTSIDGGKTWKEQTEMGTSAWRAMVTTPDSNTIIVGGSAGKYVIGKY